MTADTKRLQYVDVIKGIAVLMIVLSHLMAPCIGRVILMHLEAVFLACLFFFSGFSYREADIGAAERVKKRSAALMRPFVISSLLFWLIGSLYMIAVRTETLRDALLCLRNFYAGVLWDGTFQYLFHLKGYFVEDRYYFLTDLWLLLAMMFASVIFYLIADRALRSGKETMMAAAGLFAVTGVFQGFGLRLPYNLQMAPYWAAFMLLGAFAGKHRLFDRIKKEDKWMPGIISLALGVTVAMIKHPSTDIYRGSFGEHEVLSMLLCVLAAIPAIWGLGHLSSLAVGSGRSLSMLTWLGTNSLTVFISHRFIAWIIGVITGFSVLYGAEVTGGTIAKSLLLCLVVVALCAAPAVIPASLRERNEKRKRRARIAAARRSQNRDDEGSKK